MGMDREGGLRKSVCLTHEIGAPFAPSIPNRILISESNAMMRKRGHTEQQSNNKRRND